jgi:hypothetical protein
MDLRKHLNQKHFPEYAVGNPMDIKTFQIKKWALTKAGSFRSWMGTWQLQPVGNFAATIIGQTPRDIRLLDELPLLLPLEKSISRNMAHVV